MEIKIPTPRDFSFERTAHSHGWTGLLPFEVDPKASTLIRVLDIGTATPVTVAIAGTKRAVNVSLPRKVGVRAARLVERDVRHMLRTVAAASPRPRPWPRCPTAFTATRCARATVLPT